MTKFSLPSNQVLERLEVSVAIYPFSTDLNGQPRSSQAHRHQRKGDLFRRLLSISFACLCLFCVLLSIPLSPVSMFPPTLLAIVALIGMICGLGLPFMIQASRISGQIARERQRGTYDLIAASTVGAFGLHLWIAAQKPPPQQSMQGDFSLGLPMTLLIVGLTGIGLWIFGGLFWSTLMTATMETVVVTSYIVTMIASIGLYFLQSRSAGLLMGILVPAYVEKPLESQFWAIATFISYQLSTIGITFLIGFVLPAIFAQTTNRPPGIMDLLLIVIRFGFFVGSREIIIAVCWQHLRHQLKAQDSDRDFLTRLRFSYHNPNLHTHPEEYQANL